MASAYDLLGVPRTASVAQIRHAYREKARAMHPDKVPGDPTATTRFQQLTEAYQHLSTPARRQQYDRHGAAVAAAAQPPAAGSSSAHQLFEEVFGSPSNFFAAAGAPPLFDRHATPFRRHVRFGNQPFDSSSFSDEAFFQGPSVSRFRPYAASQRHQGSTSAGHDGAVSPPEQVVVPLTVSLEELALGFSKQVSVPGPGGGYTWWLPVNGEPGWHAGRQIMATPSIIVELVETPHPRFTRVGDDLETTVTVALQAALCGCEVVVKSLFGDDLVLRAPLVTPGMELTIPDEGMPHEGGTTRGQLRVKFAVEFPSMPLSAEHRALLADILATQTREQDLCRTR